MVGCNHQRGNLVFCPCGHGARGRHSSDRCTRQYVSRCGCRKQPQRALSAGAPQIRCRRRPRQVTSTTRAGALKEDALSCASATDMTRSSATKNGADHKPAGSGSIAKCNHHRLGSPVRRGCSTPPCCRSVPASVAFENIFTQFRFRLVIFTGSVVHSGTGARAACFMRAPPMACRVSKLKLSPHQFTSSNHARGKAILPYRSAARRGAVTCDCLRLKPRAMAICSSDT